MVLFFGLSAAEVISSSTMLSAIRDKVLKKRRGNGGNDKGHLTGRSLRQRNERLPFLDDIRGEFRPVAAADVLRRVDRSGRNEQDLARLERHRRLALDLILQQAFYDIDDLFARMRMLRGYISRIEVDAHLNNLASGGAEIVPLKIGSFGGYCRTALAVSD